MEVTGDIAALSTRPHRGLAVEQFIAGGLLPRAQIEQQDLWKLATCIYRAERLDSQSPAAMIPVNIKPATSSTSAVYLYGSGGHILQLPADVSPQWLGELLKCLD